MRREKLFIPRLAPVRLLPLLLGCLLLHGAALRARAQSSTLPPAYPEGVAQALTQQAGLEGRILWLDGTANLERLSTRPGVAAILEKCQKARINTIVVDVKPLSGHVLYDSKIAPKLKEWRGFRYPEGYDLLRVTLEEGHKRGFKVYAAINVFSDAHKLVGSGPLYERPEQQTIIYDVARTLTTSRGDRKTMAPGVNRQPGPNEISVYDPNYSVPRVMQPGDNYALVHKDRVVAVAEGSTAARGVQVPPDGYLLVGRGEAGRWLVQGLKVGDILSWTATDRLIPVLDAPSESVAAFVNPSNPVSREYELKIVDELASRYDFDGICFDRMRYASLQSDFSDLSRQQFETYLGQKLNRWPGDVYSFDPTPGRPLAWGPYFKPWLEWRARNIRTWLEDAVKIVRSKRPAAKTSVYVGAWYNGYYAVGVNWGTEELAPEYDWMTANYPLTGYAGLLDWVTTGCYYPIATRQQAKTARLDDSYTVQAAAELSNHAVGDAAFVYAGLYLEDYRRSPVALREAIQAARGYSQGVMLFDLSHIEDYRMWPVLEEMFPDARVAPHDVPELLPAVRTLRRALREGNRNSLP